MCRKLILLVSVVLVLDMVPISGAGAADPDLIGAWSLISVDHQAGGNWTKAPGILPLICPHPAMTGL